MAPAGLSCITGLHPQFWGQELAHLQKEGRDLGGWTHRIALIWITSCYLVLLLFKLGESVSLDINFGLLCLEFVLSGNLKSCPRVSRDREGRPVLVLCCQATRRTDHLPVDTWTLCLHPWCSGMSIPQSTLLPVRGEESTCQAGSTVQLIVQGCELGGTGFSWEDAFQSRDGVLL